MTLSKRLLVTVMIGTLAAAAALAWFRTAPTGKGSAATQARTESTSGRADPLIELNEADLLTVATGRLVRSLPVTGTITAASQTLVRARVSGDIIDIPVREGMSVKAGQLIARIDPADFELRLSERTAQLRSAQAQLEQARRTLENNARLLDKAFISQNAYDNSRFAVDGARAAVEAADAQLAQARKALADTRIIAPMSGVVAQRFVQPGEKVSPDGRIVSIIDLEQLEIEVAVPASDIAAIRPGQRASLRAEGLAQVTTAKVLRINPATTAGTRSITVYLGLDQSDERLRAGMFAQGTLIIDERDGLLLVPLSALRERAGQRYVYLIEQDRIVERVVALGLIDETALAPGGFTGAAEVRSGLQAGAKIVRQNLGALVPGSRVRIAGSR